MKKKYSVFSYQSSVRDACHPEPIREVYPERGERAQGRLREGSPRFAGGPDGERATTEILRPPKDGGLRMTIIRAEN
jgi:hypothetical protein